MKMEQENSHKVADCAGKMARSLRSGRTFPILLVDCEIPELLRDLKYLDARHELPRAVSELIPRVSQIESHRRLDESAGSLSHISSSTLPRGLAIPIFTFTKGSRCHVICSLDEALRAKIK
jgi:hypothetical protein